MRTNSFIKKLVVLGTVGSLLAPYCFYPKLQAAERFEIHFDGMSIPISIKELIDWSNGAEEKNSELASWLNLLGFKERKGLAKFLGTPLVRDKSMARQILRSWSGRKLLDEVSDLILMDEDSSGESVLDTLEKLLNEKDEVVSCPGASFNETDNEQSHYHQNLRLFQYPHDVCIDKDENIYVAQWNSGNTYPIKLERV